MGVAEKKEAGPLCGLRWLLQLLARKGGVLRLAALAGKTSGGKCFPAYSRAPKNSTPPFRLFVGGRAAYPLPVCTSSKLSTSSGVCSSMALPPSA